MVSDSICKGKVNRESQSKGVIKKLVNEFEEGMENPFFKQRYDETAPF
jgi:hypothetical protein